MQSSTGARVLKIILGSTFIVMGSAFTYFLWLSYQRAETTRRWEPTEALVVTSQVLTEHATPHSPISYRANVRYRYTFEGKAFNSTRIRRVDGPTSSRAKAEGLIEEHPVGQMVTCYVNQAQPDFAILEHESRAGLYSIWFPILFVLGGLGMVRSAIKKQPV